MAGIEVDLEQHRIAAGRVVAQLRDPLGRFPIGHAGIGQACDREDRRVGQRGDIVVGRIGRDRRVVPLGRDRVAPFRPFRRRERQGFVQHRGQDVDERHLGDDRREILRRHVGDRAHQQSARRAALRDQPVMPGEALRHQVPGGGDEVGERVRLSLALAGLVPAVALVLAAANMGDRIDEAAVDQGQDVCVEGSRYGDAVGTVAIDQARRRAVERRVPVVEQRDRNAFPVRSGCHQPTGDIMLRLVAGRHVLCLQERPLARPHIVVEELRRRGHRRIVQAHNVGVIFQRPVKAE